MAKLYKRKTSNVCLARVKIWDEARDKWIWKSVSTGIKDESDSSEAVAQSLADDLEKVSRMGKSMTSRVMDVDRFTHLVESIFASAENEFSRSSINWVTTVLLKPIEY